MGLLDKLTPTLYAFVKRNRKFRNAVMPFWLFTAKAYVKVRSFANRSEILPPPRGVANSTADWVKAALKRQPSAADQYTLVQSSIKVARALPKTIEKDVHWKFHRHVTHAHPDTFVAVIEDGRAYGEGAVITPDNLLLAEVSRTIDAGEYVKDPSVHPVFKETVLPPLKKVKGRVAVLSAPSGRGYYHWMFDVLPRIQLLRDAGHELGSIDKFLVNNYVSKFHIETLNALGIPREKVLESHWNPHVKADQLIVPSLVGDTGQIPAYACEFLRRELLDKAPVRPDSPRRLYFNRRQVTHRKVTNEPAIIDLLGKHGFQSVALESLPLMEQIALLANAEVVVVPHGAGLTNIVFCRPGTKVIELLSPNAVNIMYWTLSNQVGLDYYYVLAEGERPPDHVNVHRNSLDMSFDLDELAGVLEMAIPAPARQPATV